MLSLRSGVCFTPSVLTTHVSSTPSYVGPAVTESGCTDLKGKEKAFPSVGKGEELPVQEQEI
jgi:hypothetical protein